MSQSNNKKNHKYRNGKSKVISFVMLLVKLKIKVKVFLLHQFKSRMIENNVLDVVGNSMKKLQKSIFPDVFKEIREKNDK